MEDKDIATDDDTEGEETVADSKIEAQEDTEAEVIVLNHLGEHHVEDGGEAVHDAEGAVGDDQPVQEGLGGLLGEEVDQGQVGGHGQEARHGGGGHHGEGGVALPGVLAQVLVHSHDLNTVCCYRHVHVDWELRAGGWSTDCSSPVLWADICTRYLNREY